MENGVLDGGKYDMHLSTDLTKHACWHNFIAIYIYSNIGSNAKFQNAIDYRIFLLQPVYWASKVD